MGVFFMEKYGFVYIWYDCKRKMYYVGCHWGTEHDGYICSSIRMMKAYKNRPQDFKRRIIKRNIPRQSLLAEEYHFLSMIKDEELNDRYYNTQNNHFNHWSNLENKDEIKIRCGEKNKGRKHNLTPEELSERGRKISESKQKKKAERLALGLPVRRPNSVTIKGRVQSQEEKDKRSKSLKKAWEEGRNIGTTGKKYQWTDERKKKHKASVQGCHDNRNSKKYSEGSSRAWSEGKYASRKPNNMREYIWVKQQNGLVTRIHKDNYDPLIHTRGRK